MKSPYTKESFLNRSERAVLLQLINRYNEESPLLKPAVVHSDYIEIAGTQLLTQGCAAEAELLAKIRQRCQTEIESCFTLTRPVFPESTVLRADYLIVGKEQGESICSSKATNRQVTSKDPTKPTFTCIIFLNRCNVDFDGGELSFSNSDQFITPAPGLLAAYPDKENVEVKWLPLKSGVCYSLLIRFGEDPAATEGPLARNVSKNPAKNTGPRKLILRNHQAPGDLLMLTAAVRDLHMSHPGKFVTDVDTPFPELWQGNPFLTKLKAEDGAEVLQMHYPIIHESNEGAYHFIHGFRLYLEEKLGVRIKATKFWGDIHLANEETSGMSLVQEKFTDWDTPFWLICTGGKNDYTAKWWIPEFAQEVVDYFKNRIQFVQFGGEGPNHHHPPLQGVINLVGKTDLRAFIRLMYHASGVVCPVTFAMHLAAAMPAKRGLPRRKACVVTAGGREPYLFTAYTHHVYLHTNGQMRCCENGGCWKSRTVRLNDGNEKDQSVCIDTVHFHDRRVQRCMHDLVTAGDVIRAIERYHVGGALKYLPEDRKTIEAI